MTELVADQQLDSGVNEFPDPEVGTYNAFVKNIQLAQIEVSRILAERVAVGDSSETNFETRVGFAALEDAVHWRIACDAKILDSDGDTLGVVEVAVLVTAQHSLEEPPSPEVMAYFANASALVMAHPYLRETIATAAQRIGLPNVLLPLITR